MYSYSKVYTGVYSYSKVEGSYSKVYTGVYSYSKVDVVTARCTQECIVTAR